MPPGKRYCCVTGCTNNQLTPGVTMHQLPRRKGLESSGRRLMWLENIGRRDKDFPELLWDPDSSCVHICSKHFVNGRPSTKPEDVDYVPTIFYRIPTSRKRKQKGKGNPPPKKKKPVSSISPKTTEQRVKQAHTQKLLKNAAKTRNKNRFFVEQRNNERQLDYISKKRQEAQSAEDNTLFGHAVWETDHDYIKTLSEHSCMTEKESLEVKIESLQAKIAEHKRHMVTLDSLPDEEFPFFTGLASRKVFDTVCDYLEERPTVPECRSESERLPRESMQIADTQRKNHPMSFPQELFMVLVKLKRGYSDRELSFFFDVPEDYISTVFTSYIQWLLVEFKFLFEMPQAEPRDVPGIVVVLDLTERHALEPTKFVVGVSPMHVVEFVSPISSGGNSLGPVATVSAMDLLDVLPEGSCLMAQQEFFIREDLLELGVELIVPCAIGAISNLSREADSSERISEAFKRMEKIVKTICSFHILEARPMREVKDMRVEVFTCCAYLINLQTAPEMYTYSQGCDTLHMQ